MENMQAFVLDVFCSGSTAGNPAAVCVLTAWPADLMLQTFAAAQSAPVTVFILLPPAQATAQPIPVRWFAGRQEINLCGHGSLAAAALLFARQPQRQHVWLTSRFGDVQITRSDVVLAADLPVFALTLPAWPAQQPDGLSAMVQSLNLSAQGCELTDCFATRDLIVVLATAAQVRAFVPDFTALRQLQDYHATILTAPLYAPDGQSVIGYVLRYFAPNIGIDEDLATGSAQCSLAPYWLARSGTSRLQVQQLSAGGGYFLVEPHGHGQICVHAAARISPTTALRRAADYHQISSK